MTMIQLFNYAGIFVFAATGALAASRRQLDIIAFVFLAAVTGIGGGTLRDLILGVPVFWVKDPGNLMVCAAAAILVYFSANLLESRYRVLLWLDALGLAAYSVIGAAKSLALGFDSTIAIVTGIMTATFGGILRDIISGEPSVLMRREIYVTAALAGSVTYISAAQPCRRAGDFRTRRSARRICRTRRCALFRLGAPDISQARPHLGRAEARWLYQIKVVRLARQPLSGSAAAADRSAE